MPDAASASHDPPSAPPADAFQPHHHHHAPDDEPLPSYDEAVRMTEAPPSYGTFRPYSDESSMASSEVESTDRALPERLGQALVVFVFICLIYGFWEFINAPDVPSDWPGNGRFTPSGT